MIPKSKLFRVLALCLGSLFATQVNAQEGAEPIPEAPSVETTPAADATPAPEAPTPAPEAPAPAPEAPAPETEVVVTEIDPVPTTEVEAESDSMAVASGGTVVEASEGTKVPSAPEVESDIPVEKKDSFYANYIQDRLRVGTRVLWYSLTDTESGEEFDGSFIGSLNRTTEDQDPAPVYFYAEYSITPYFGIGVSYDQFKVVTLDSGGGDGTFELDGPILYGFGRFENGSAFTPFLELGVAFYGIDFDAKPEWTFGNGNFVRNRFETEDSTGFVVGGGLDIEIIEHLSVNLYLRYVSVDIDVDYVFTPNPQTERITQGTFPGDHFAYGLGIAYTF